MFLCMSASELCRRHCLRINSQRSWCHCGLCNMLRCWALPLCAWRLTLAVSAPPCAAALLPSGTEVPADAFSPQVARS